MSLAGLGNTYTSLLFGGPYSAVGVQILKTTVTVTSTDCVPMATLVGVAALSEAVAAARR